MITWCPVIGEVTTHGAVLSGAFIMALSVVIGLSRLSGKSLCKIKYIY